jgi:plasmid stabilization system protein ParE
MWVYGRRWWRLVRYWRGELAGLVDMTDGGDEEPEQTRNGHERSKKGWRFRIFERRAGAAQ